MIRSYFGLSANPFQTESLTLLEHQQKIFDTLKVHCQQGGLCLLLGQPGTGKSVIKTHLQNHDPKRMLTPTVARTLHTYSNTLRILCQAFGVEVDGGDFKCEKRLIEEAFRMNHLGKMIATIIDDAHLLDMHGLRKLRLLLEDFPKNHNLILIGQPTLLTNLHLSVNDDIKSRITYSVVVSKLNPDQIEDFIKAQLDAVALAHGTFSEEAMALIVRSADGLLRRTKNLCRACLLEAVRDHLKCVGLPQVNRVLLQPHWRAETDFNQF